MIAIIDYGAGNLTSVQRALTYLHIDSIITDNPDTILKAGKVIFPGVGAAQSALQKLRKVKLDITLKEFLTTQKPLLGICLGSQIILSSSEENNHTVGLNFVQGKAILLKNDSQRFIQIPHIGWNQVQVEKKNHFLFNNIPNNSDFYFDHSYFVTLEDVQHIVGKTQYGVNECISVLQKDNLVACQFHPEKSGKWGLQLLKNFSNWSYSTE